MSNIGKIYQKFADKSKLSTPYLSRPDKYGYVCTIYFPIYDVAHNGDFSEVDIFSTHKNAKYGNTPDITDNFYIPYLLKKQIMNSSSTEFETFYLEGEDERPFIETTIELPIASKVIVHFTDNSTMLFWIEKKTIVPGGVFMRMYLNPLV